MLIFISILMIFHKEKQDELIEKIQMGDTKEQVILLLGKPNDLLNCQENSNLWWGNIFLGRDKENTCKTVFKYGITSIDYWTISFDRNNRVISKYRYVCE